MGRQITKYIREPEDEQLNLKSFIEFMHTYKLVGDTQQEPRTALAIRKILKRELSFSAVDVRC